MAKTVTKNTRAGMLGRMITCPKCRAQRRVYNFGWPWLECWRCKARVEKLDWIDTGSPTEGQCAMTSSTDMTKEEERPALTFTNAADGSGITMGFGNYKGVATTALFHGDSLVLIPRDILKIALEQGWDDDNSCPHCKEAK
jgi:hypothetical protein